jgi:hypothetical protein
MAIFGNFKGTTQPEFKVGKTGAVIHGNTTAPTSASIVSGDIWLDKNNATIRVYSSNTWTSIGSTLTALNVDSGTLYVDTANDTVSVGSLSSNEKLFVNGNIRLGTNPAIKYAGAYLDVQHATATGTVFRIRDNTGNVAPQFKIFGANNIAEVFSVNGNATTVNGRLTAGNLVYPVATGTEPAGMTLVTDGAGNLTLTTSDGPIEDYGSIAEAANVIADYGNLAADTRSPTPHDSYTVAETLAIAGPTPGDMVFVSNETGGATMAFYDGTNWRRVQDRAVIS